MKRILIGFVVLASLITSYAYAEVYTYTGNNFTSVFGPYTTAMRVTGTITTSVPIPPNSVTFDPSGILTSWSFNDGVNTINNVNGVFHPLSAPRVDTDASGNITAAGFIAFSSPMPTAIGDEHVLITTSFSLDTGLTDAICVSVSEGFCNASNGLGASVSSSGVWVTVPEPAPVPSMSQWSLMLLTLLMGMVGLARLKHISPPRDI